MSFFAIQKFLFVLFHLVSPWCFILQRNPCAFCEKQEKTPWKWRDFHAPLSSGVSAGKRSLRLLLSSFVTNKITWNTCNLRRNTWFYFLFRPVSVEIQVLPACSRFVAFLLRRDCQTPGLSNSRFCTFEGAPVLLFPCHRDSNLPRGCKNLIAVDRISVLCHRFSVMAWLA